MYIRLNKYFAYVDDDHEVYKLCIPAESEESAREWCEGSGEVVAIKDVTEEYPIDAGKVRRALSDAGFIDHEVDWMVRALQDFQIIE